MAGKTKRGQDLSQAQTGTRWEFYFHVAMRSRPPRVTANEKTEPRLNLHPPAFDLQAPKPCVNQNLFTAPGWEIEIDSPAGSFEELRVGSNFFTNCAP